MMGISKPIMRRIQGAMFKMPLMISCEEFEGFIIDYLEDALTPKQKLVFETHLKICTDCREYLRAYKAAIELANGSADAAEEPLPDQVPDDLVKAVLAARDA